MKNKRFVLLVSGMILLSLLLAACSPTKEASFPNGKFIKVGESTRSFIFNEDGTWIVLEGSSTLVRATYSVDGTVFTETSNDGGCETNVDFTYRFDGKNLTFNYAGDPDDDFGCSGRRADMNNVTYTLSE
ncbi:MAG TPA: hypothetical protein VK897_05390 [Anaerolineales bacterium]|nr:hypothetical protein [Anaerolineales bacterium]